MEQELVFMTIKEPYYIETYKNIEYEGPSSPPPPPTTTTMDDNNDTMCKIK